MKFITRLRQSEENLYTICNTLFKLLDVKVTSKSLKEEINKHIYFPSLLTISDVLKEYGIVSAALNRNQHSFDDFEVPYIVSIQKPEWSHAYFTIIRNTQNAIIEFYDPVHLNWKTEEVETFQKWDKNVVFLVEKEEINGEINYTKKRNAEKKIHFVKNLPIYSFFCFIILSIVITLRNTWPQIPFFGFIMLVLYTAGAIISFLLTWYEIDSQNPFLKEVCSGSKKVNCSAVLQANGANFYGIEWSVIGLSYFLAGILSILILGLNNIFVLSILGGLSILASSYIIYSIYYQYKIVNQWCILCIGVQGILFLQMIFSTFYIANYNNWPSISNLQSLNLVLLLFGLVVLVLIYTTPIIKKAKNGRIYEMKWKRMKANPNVFFSLLSEQPKIAIYPHDLGIVLGNPEAKNEIIKVCSPFCKPCGKVHKYLNTILKNDNYKIRIIFTAYDLEVSPSPKPVKHLLSIYEEKTPLKLKEAVHTWFDSNNARDYTYFHEKFKNSPKQLELQTPQLIKMKDWCEDMKIWSTPTFYFNGHHLPDEYNIKDLSEFL